MDENWWLLMSVDVDWFLTLISQWLSIITFGQKITYFYLLGGLHVQLTPKKCFLEAFSTKSPWNAPPGSTLTSWSPDKVGLRGNSGIVYWNKYFKCCGSRILYCQILHKILQNKLMIVFSIYLTTLTSLAENNLFDIF